MDHASVSYPVGKAISVDLRDPASIDRAIDEVGGPVHAVFSAAGVADGPDLMRINFIGHRHLIERMFGNGQLPRGSAICFISSLAGMGWENDLARLQSSWPRLTTSRRTTGSRPMRPRASFTTASPSRSSTRMWQSSPIPS